MSSRAGTQLVCLSVWPVSGSLQPGSMLNKGAALDESFLSWLMSESVNMSACVHLCVYLLVYIVYL